MIVPRSNSPPFMRRRRTSRLAGCDSLTVKPARWREGVNFQAAIARFSTAKLLMAAPPLFSIIIAQAEARKHDVCKARKLRDGRVRRRGRSIPGLPVLLDALRIMSVPGFQIPFYDMPRQRRANVPGIYFNALEFLRAGGPGGCCLSAKSTRTCTASCISDGKSHESIALPSSN